MAHIHTLSGQHDFTVSVYIVRQFDDIDWRIALHVHKKHNSLLPFGGHIELDETPWQAVARELKEESGYDMSSLSIVLSKPKLGLVGCDEHFVPFSVNTHAIPGDVPHYHTDLTYAFVAKEEPTNAIANDESSDIRWLSLQEVEELSEKEIYQDARQLSVYVLQSVQNMPAQI